MDQGSEEELTHTKALNKLIQGSAADMTKKAMLELYKIFSIVSYRIYKYMMN